MRISETFKFEEVVGLRFGYKPFGGPKLITHIYYVDGLLIDTGQSKLRSEIIARTKGLDVSQIFVTHHHEDHTGNITSLQQIHHCKVYAPALCCQMMKNPPRLSWIQKLTWGDRPAHTELTPVIDKIETENYQFELIPIPGHAPDMVALYEPDRQWLFSADLFINSYIGYFLKDESILQQIESTKRILKLDFETMFCCHNPKLTNGKEELTKKLTFLESFYQDISELYHKGYSANEIFKGLGLKENRLVKIFSGGALSKLNMVKSVIRDLENKC